MIAFTIAVTLCHVTAPTPNPLVDPKFTDCHQELRIFEAPTDNMAAGRIACRMAMQDLGSTINIPAMQEIARAKKFPHSVKQWIVKEMTCRAPVSPQTS